MLAQNFSVPQTLHNLFTTGFYILASKSALHSVPSPQEHFSATFSPCGSRPPTRPPRIPASWCSSSCQCYPLMRRSLSVQQIEYDKKSYMTSKERSKKAPRRLSCSLGSLALGEGQLPCRTDIQAALRRGPRNEMRNRGLRVNSLQPHQAFTTAVLAGMTETWSQNHPEDTPKFLTHRNWETECLFFFLNHYIWGNRLHSSRYLTSSFFPSPMRHPQIAFDLLYWKKQTTDKRKKQQNKTPQNFLHSLILQSRGWINFFCWGPDSKYLTFCEPVSAVTTQPSDNTQMGVAVLQQNCIYNAGSPPNSANGPSFPCPFSRRTIFLPFLPTNYMSWWFQHSLTPPSRLPRRPPGVCFTFHPSTQIAFSKLA